MMDPLSSEQIPHERHLPYQMLQPPSLCTTALLTAPHVCCKCLPFHHRCCMHSDHRHTGTLTSLSGVQPAVCAGCRQRAEAIRADARSAVPAKLAFHAPAARYADTTTTVPICAAPTSTPQAVSCSTNSGAVCSTGAVQQLPSGHTISQLANGWPLLLLATAICLHVCLLPARLTQQLRSMQMPAGIGKGTQLARNGDLPVSRPSVAMFLQLSASRHLPLEQMRLRQSHEPTPPLHIWPTTQAWKHSPPPQSTSVSRRSFTCSRRGTHAHTWVRLAQQTGAEADPKGIHTQLVLRPQGHVGCGWADLDAHTAD